jgi:hypothetical protein
MTPRPNATGSRWVRSVRLCTPNRFSGPLTTMQCAEKRDWFKSPKSLSGLSDAETACCKSQVQNWLRDRPNVVPYNEVCQSVSECVSDRYCSVLSLS